VHTVVSFDFAVGIVPGWHATIFPPYFVAGAIYAGFAMVTTLAIPLRRLFGLEDFITMRHLQNMAKGMLATGLIVVYGMLAMGWRGSARHWHQYDTAYLLLAGLATPLVVSVHTVVSFDFAISIVPGWHTTIFPPYFVAGAIYSGFAMVLTLAIPIRAVYGLNDFITSRHLQNMAKVMLVTGLIVAYGYTIEAFMAWYGGDKYEGFMIWNRMTGPYAPAYWALLFCNVLTPQLLWFRRVRNSVAVLFVISLIVNVGMWLERFVIVVTSLHRDFLPSSWGMYRPTIWDWGTYVGTIGLFVALLLLFLRFLPMISIFEMRTILPSAKVDEDVREDLRVI